MEEFIKDFKEEMLNKHSIFFQHVFASLITLLSKNQSISFLSCLFMAFIQLVPEFKRPLFRYPNSICSSLCLQTLDHCNSKILITRTEACDLLYNLIIVIFFFFFNCY